MELSVRGSQGATPWAWHPGAVQHGPSVTMLVNEEAASLPELKAVFSALTQSWFCMSATVLNG